LRGLNFLLAEIKESFLMAMGSLAAHKLRSALTLLGILVGVFSIIIVMTAMKAMQRQITNELKQLGGQTFIISKFPIVYLGGNKSKFWLRRDLTLEQGKRLMEKATLPRSIGLEARFYANTVTSRFQPDSQGVSLMGETPGAFLGQNWVVKEGRALSDGDVDGGHDVCVLGSTLATNLFPFGSAIDERVKFDSINYTVVGVLEPKGTMAGGNQDNFAIIPVTTGLSRYGSRGQSISYLVQARSEAEYEDTVEQVRSILRAIRRVPPGEPDDFEVFSPDSVLAQINTITFAVRLGVTLVSSIALVAAGIGIMNIMLVSVTERTREIGIRRAIGAKKRNIMVQFIMEAIVLCEVGGAIGVVLGIIGGNVGAHFMKLPAVIPYDWAIIGLLICSVVGIIFGTYPAYKAANLDPIDSLRYE
jgi:putative ABC transport system permease protein